MSRTLAAVLALVLGLNALAMLFASFWWYGAVPGVIATGAYNPHFVRDIGAAYLVAAGGLAWFAWRPVQGWPALAAAAAFLTLHAVIHVYDAGCGPRPVSDVLRDLPGVYLPALIALALVLLRKPREIQ
ncbi:MAG: hypothetical protein ACK41C_12080 [Phenylobacterium sp.]|uniref:hypothetical protein n=1 Tax=Phenylobacterium sp. TaxID=1871053 RepID=UPI00391A05D4